ncbi:hypothetical protein MTBLM1_120026 [Rhodospirillaceae bacterium LM-1]|nr:hypothetical protein MTBLM1_120026 [Rhodospirillaceae bacterium LM-1]
MTGTYNFHFCFVWDELPELPKIDWGAEGKPRIDNEKRAMHENWARLINSTQDFGGIIPTFKRHIETNGEASDGCAKNIDGFPA